MTPDDADLKGITGGRVSIQGVSDAVGITTTADDGTYPTYRIVSRADLLAAIAAECGVIIVDRAELPEVTEAPYVLAAGPVDHGMTRDDALDHRAWALGHLALAEYLGAHPPVDEAQVEALDGAVKVADPRMGVYDRTRLVRRLAELGVRVEGGRA